MGQDQALDLLNQLMWQTVVIAGPILAAVLIVGLIVSVLQATTQLQEITLSYVPKMLAAAIIMIALGPWMIGRMAQFARSTIAIIPGIG